MVLGRNIGDVPVRMTVTIAPFSENLGGSEVQDRALTGFTFPGRPERHVILADLAGSPVVAMVFTPVVPESLVVSFPAVLFALEELP
jgi:hypothetical protein